MGHDLQLPQLHTMDLPCFFFFIMLIIIAATIASSTAQMMIVPMFCVIHVMLSAPFQLQVTSGKWLVVGCKLICLLIRLEEHERHAGYQQDGYDQSDDV